MDYVELEPPVTLRRHVQCLWRLQDPSPTRMAQTVYPDGRCEFIAHLGVPMRRYTLARGWQMQQNCLFAAQHRSAIRLAADGPLDCIGVRLRAAAGAVIAGAQLAVIADEIVPMADLDAEFAIAYSAAARMLSADGDAAALWRLLESRIGSKPIDTRIESAAAILDAASGQRTIASLASELRMSPRGLQTRFLAHVGLTPKECARVQRLQATIRQLDASPDPLAELAVDSGFSDQAHATRELLRLTGLTPARLRRALAAAREGDETLLMAAAFVRGKSGDRVHLRMARLA